MNTLHTQVRTLQVACITKPNRFSSHEGITHLGGPGWKLPTAQVIAAIEMRSAVFYTSAAGSTSWVGVVHGPHGKYLRAHADHQWNDNLLALPQCL